MAKQRLTMAEKVAKVTEALRGYWERGVGSVVTDDLVGRTGLTRSHVNEVGRLHFKYAAAVVDRATVEVSGGAIWVSCHRRSWNMTPVDKRGRK